MVSMVAALAIGCGSKKEGGSEKNEGTTEKTKYEQIMEKGSFNNWNRRNL